MDTTPGGRPPVPLEEHQPSVEEILERIPREQIDALVAGAPERLRCPAAPDDLDRFRVRLEQLRRGQSDPEDGRR